MQKRTIHKILIPTDFSVGARRASKIGIEYAKQFNADVILFHSFSIPVVDITANVNALENLKSAVEQDLKKEVQNTDHIIHEDSEKTWVRGGLPTRQIMRNIDYEKRCEVK